MSYMLAERPIIIILTFHHPSFKTGPFLMISFVVAWCHGSRLLFEWSLIPMYPMRMEDSGGTAPYWLGAAQLEAGDSCPVRSEPIERWLVTGICCSPCCVHADGEAGVSSPGVEVGVGD